MTDPVPDPAPPASSEFEHLVRDALLHLHDAAYLQMHALARSLESISPSSAPLRGKRLLKALLDAIEALRAEPGTASDSRAWRAYHLLELRYVEGLSASEVTEQLAISKAQYQRDHARALAAVASLLHERLPPDEAERRAASDSRESLALSEAAQLAAQARPNDVDLAATLADLVALLQPSAVENAVALRLHPSPGLPPVWGDRVAIRQAFLGLFTTALRRAPQGALEIGAERRGEEVDVLVVAAPGPGSAPPGPADTSPSPEVEVARRLVEALGGQVDVVESPAARPWRARVTLPVSRRPIALVVDNQPDFIGLVARYLGGHGWQVTGAESVQRAQAVALELRPSVILLDVMMPGQDGWDLLLALKARPETRAIPIVVCSVLYEPQVARALGAAAYLPKPVSQAALLEALAPWQSADPPGTPGRAPTG